MAEFCLKCHNQLFGENLTPKEVVLEDGLCEGCAEIKPCVIAIKKYSRSHKLLQSCIGWAVVVAILVILKMIMDGYTHE